MFCLQLSNYLVREYESDGYEGTIIIGDLKESFFAEKKFYEKNDYYKQWKRAVEKILSGKNSYFLTSLGEPQHSNYYMGWIVYNYENNLYVQNKLFLAHQFSLQHILEMTVELPKFSRITEDGEDISTWETTMQEIKEYRIFLEEYLESQQE